LKVSSTSSSSSRVSTSRSLVGSSSTSRLAGLLNNLASNRRARSPPDNALTGVRARCGLNRKGVHNRIIRGVGWAEADELAIRFGYMPWEVWPEWANVDPTTWMPPVCRQHGNTYLMDLDDLTQECGVCAVGVDQAA